MAHDGPKRPIPSFDRAREQIAARRAERLRRLHYGGEPPPIEPDVFPVYLSFREAIGWIAYGRITALEGDLPEVTAFYDRWKHMVLVGGSDLARRHSLVVSMRHVIARVHWWQRNKSRRRKLVPLDPLHHIARAHVRWAIRNHGGGANATLSSLLNDARELLAAEDRHEAAISKARRTLIAEIAAGEIEAFGLPGTWRTKTYASGQPVAIPPTYFANPNNTIRLDGWATCSDDVSPDTWAKWSGPDYGDVRLKRADIMRLWPANVLPAWLNPMQAVAWIVTRNPGIVELAAEPRPNLTAEAAGVWDLPRDGVSLLWLNLHVGSERAEAELKSLVQAARDGIVTVTGLRTSDHTRHPLGADWWHDHVLAECRARRNE